MNSTTSNGADGTASVDLRGLGNQRTLVLVDGLRLGPGSAIGGRNYSDINQIPAALIERVDVLTGGASSVYGADAVAGVVNFILNTHFEGVRVDAGYHFNEHNNNDQSGVASLRHRRQATRCRRAVSTPASARTSPSSWARTLPTTRATRPPTSPMTTRARRCRASSTTAPARSPRSERRTRWRAPAPALRRRMARRALLRLDRERRQLHPPYGGRHDRHLPQHHVRPAMPTTYNYGPLNYYQTPERALDRRRVR